MSKHSPRQIEMLAADLHDQEAREKRIYMLWAERNPSYPPDWKDYWLKKAEDLLSLSALQEIIRHNSYHAWNDGFREAHAAYCLSDDANQPCPTTGVPGDNPHAEDTR